MSTDVFALLDDASADGEGLANSRLYTGHAGTLVCRDIQAWPQLLDQMQAALERGQFAVTLCSYELGGHLLGLGPRHQSAPLAQVLLFDACQSLSPGQVQAWLSARADTQRPAGIARLRDDIGADDFAHALGRIHDYIEAGDTYQVNYTYRLRFDAFGTPSDLYARLRRRQPVPYGALVALPDGGALLSLSPELFVRHAQGELTARPMKGTAPAAPADQADENARRASALSLDAKNRAENLMIVDLLRNDIGRIAVTGSVKVPALFEVRRYSGVLQMTSTVQAALRPNARLHDIFQALYPCGSITGAPKLRAMEIIDELEANPRGIYTGAIGWFDPPAHGHQVGDFCMSVPIRTLTLQAPRDGVRSGEMGVGAGIVHDSDTPEEFAECRLKGRFLTGLGNDFELFETMRGSHDGVQHLERHLRRLSASAAYFGFPSDEAAARACLMEACAAFTPGVAHRLRLSLDQSGAYAVRSGLLAPLAEPVRAMLAEEATSASDLFLRHKTSVRTRYDDAWRAAEAQGCFDMLFFNERGELTEGGRCNVFIKLDGRWLTPPLSCGLLPGIQRAVLLDDPAWHASERIITRAMLDQAQEIVLCNSLRGVLRVQLL
ncbi:aminodeoxychorismate synthase component I [Janthinobacterium agaricidamnosum]|uniref:Aminodeoxychorismate synthase, component I n=1 Tax=Janthinobacterium agaricidamnosum NBRC 102515 = DSM 9628 TaxID=1349767 RepID=W0VER0_9BURK|nr:aminodeoxychorismate synthase component I [Janthinobacterium agaricidamnosum]CDG85837.1 aminodeoxychorismate synthase, component I [Janthinobacterium agaricidamnosum NBRC 102515 = DSM 9628]